MVASSPSESRCGLADAIFEAVLELPAHERSQAIAERCAGDPELAELVGRQFAERERCDQASRAMLDAALAEIVHGRRPG